MTSLAPRMVLVTRPSDYEALIAAHATRGQAAFWLAARGQSIDEAEARHRLEREAIAAARRALPADWSFAQVLRADLDRFLFAPSDIVVALGQDGLVANLAKYLDGQPVIGVTPDPARAEGALTPLPVQALPGLLPAVAAGEARPEARAMVAVLLSGGAELVALNELFVGHRSHQSARYLIEHGGAEEFQSSSGVIVSTGTGLSGWARSIMAATGWRVQIAPTEPRAVFFAREPWPSRNSGASIRHGEIGEGGLTLTSRMNDGGVIFADGIEQDFLPFDWGEVAEVGLSDRVLRLVRG